jgi:hypothetical protein
LLFDVFHPNREPRPDTYQAVLEQALHDPAYGLRVAEDGYLLLERGLDPGDKPERLAVVAEPQIAYPRTVQLADTVAYLGFDLSTRDVKPEQVFRLTHYWQSLEPVSLPYLIFTAYPGAARFEEAAFGLYPVKDWRPGDVIRHEQLVSLPHLPDGDAYEIAVGLWFDEGEPALRGAHQLLGHDVIRIASISARNGSYRIVPWPAIDTGERP